MNKGKVFLHDVPSKVFEHGKELREIGLDIPFVSQVKEEFKKHDIDIKEDRFNKIAEELWQLVSKK